MKVQIHKLLAAALFVGFVWLLIIVLEPVATKGWLGPVLTENLARQIDAGALFYTEVNVDKLMTTAVPGEPLAEEN